MNSTRQRHHRPMNWLHESRLAPYVDAFTHDLSERCYAPILQSGWKSVTTQTKQEGIKNWPEKMAALQRRR